MESPSLASRIVDGAKVLLAPVAIHKLGNWTVSHITPYVATGVSYMSPKFAEGVAKTVFNPKNVSGFLPTAIATNACLYLFDLAIEQKFLFLSSLPSGENGGIGNTEWSATGLRSKEGWQNLGKTLVRASYLKTVTKIALPVIAFVGANAVNFYFRGAPERNLTGAAVAGLGLVATNYAWDAAVGGTKWIYGGIDHNIIKPRREAAARREETTQLIEAEKKEEEELKAKRGSLAQVAEDKFTESAATTARLMYQILLLVAKGGEEDDIDDNTEITQEMVKAVADLYTDEDKFPDLPAKNDRKQLKVEWKYLEEIFEKILVPYYSETLETENKTYQTTNKKIATVLIDIFKENDQMQQMFQKYNILIADNAEEDGEI